MYLAEWQNKPGKDKSCAVKLASFRTSDDSVFRQFMREIEVMCQVPRHKVRYRQGHSSLPSLKPPIPQYQHASSIGLLSTQSS